MFHTRDETSLDGAHESESKAENGSGSIFIPNFGLGRAWKNKVRIVVTQKLENIYLRN